MRKYRIALVGSILLLPALSRAQTCSAAPGAPSNLRSSEANGRLLLEWNPPAGTNQPSSYRFEAGTGSGLADLVSAARGGAATTYSVPIANGTYFIRVFAKNACGTSPPSNELRADVTFGASPGAPNPRLVLGSRKVTEDIFGNALIYGEVVNGWGAGMATFIEIDAAFLSAGGALLGSDFTFVWGKSRRLRLSRLVTNTALPPGQTGCFTMFTNTTRAPVETVELTFSVQNFGTERLRGDVRVDGPVERRRDSLGDLELAGRLTNGGDRLTFFNQINFSVRNAEGRSQGCWFTFVEGSRLTLPTGVATDTALRPGASGPFTQITLTPFSNAVSITRWTTWDENESPGLLPLGRAQTGADLAGFRRWRGELYDALTATDAARQPREAALTWRSVEQEAKRITAAMR